MAHRLEKIESQMRRVLGEIFMKKGSVFDIGLISINDIVISRDLSNAKIWVSFLGEGDHRATFKRLLKSARTIQSLFYKQMPIKRVPKLRWNFDSDPTERFKMEQILDDIKRNQTEDPGV